MKKQLVLLFSVFTLAAHSQDKSAEFAQTITAEDLKKHLSIIASDSLEGRDTGSEGQRKAADYISRHFAQLGLTAIAPDGKGGKGYYQYFNLYRKGWKDVYVKIGNKQKELFKDFYPNGLLNVPQEQNVPLVFVGYGIETDKYNDYRNIDVKDKAIVFFEGEPKASDGKNLISTDSEKSDWTENKGFQKKINIAKEKGVKYIFMISSADAAAFKSLANERRVMLSRFNRVSFKSTTESPSSTASFVVSKEMAAEMLNLKLKKLLDLENKSEFSVKESKISFKAERGDVPVETMNVLGFMEGTDKKDEVVLITAHYDHVGKDEKGNVYNGADDDGSGTCAVLEIAEAFSKAKQAGNGPRRSILFMTVTGEEKGLLGSQYYTDNDPIIPLEKTVCDLNIDMIGRIDKEHANNEKYVYLIGADKLSSELNQVTIDVNKKYINYEYDYTFNDPKDPNRFYYRSDHYNFAKHKIPVAFYFTGVHADYHGIGDDVEKILFPKYQDITRLVFHTAWEIANREGRLKVDSNKP
ncbi:MAG: M28 family peptidase [Spirosomaceae bacterium]|jgi:acetylornithine deacetylase/succinyl-diaminopimelate desuccinylase-like protein|nr:M28 family peptidase [Spirosomataceae bacterium]